MGGRGKYINFGGNDTETFYTALNILMTGI